MEENKAETLSLMMEKCEPHHSKVFSEVSFNSIDNFDYLMKIDESEFDKFDLPVLPSLHLSSSRLSTIEIEDVAKMGVIDSISSRGMSDWGSIFTPKNSTSGYARSLYMNSDFNLNAENVKKNSGKKVVESNVDSLPHKK
ncbi:hypothetical protein TanjilG_03570 [Lupinus angustifolius]|uniref:Uncharacterized protein n=1 Tax=Lupinus angustifolius TaxID=3871 RepID=A0A1J7H4H4_LUPAN|nr:hypothetical protein TanjilG_03570 [Lupinus angustifolius]